VRVRKRQEGWVRRAERDCIVLRCVAVSRDGVFVSVSVCFTCIILMIIMIKVYMYMIMIIKNTYVIYTYIYTQYTTIIDN